MANGNTVFVNTQIVESLIDSKGWSNGYFGEKVMGKNRGWIAEWKRKKDGVTTPRNLPSPEEAARMCVLLQTTPEEILVDQTDIDLVKGLLEKERDAKKAPGQEAEGSAIDKDTLLNFVRNINDRAALLAVMDEVNKKLQEMG